MAKSRTRRTARAILVPAMAVCLAATGAAVASVAAPSAVTPRLFEGSMPPAGTAYFSAWRNGPPSDPYFFPIAVWMQRPTAKHGGRVNAVNYQRLGINIMINTPEPVTPADLAALPQGMYIMPGEVNELTRTSPRVIGYAAYDEPDLPRRDRGCMPPDELNATVEAFRAADPSRPVWVNFGPGMALPDFALDAPNCPIPWPGIGEWAKAGRTDDFMFGYPYRPYFQWAAIPDIVSVDHYATADYRQPKINQQLWGYGRMTRRTRLFAGMSKPVWAYVQVANVNGKDEPARPPTPEQVRVMIWMALINGATGIEYFVHSFNPWREDALLIDPAMMDMVRSINAQVTSLAPVLNEPTVSGAVWARSASPVRTLVKSLDGALYVFAIEDRGAATSATFTLTGSGVVPERGSLGTVGFSAASPDGAKVTVIGEDRTLSVMDGSFTDSFRPYGIHLYRIDPPA